MLTQVPDEVAELPATCELIFVYLYISSDPMTVAEIDQMSGIPETMIRRALSTLFDETEVVDRRKSPTDGRKYVYEICLQ